jgi:hypothetical protein
VDNVFFAGLSPVRNIAAQYIYGDGKSFNAGQDVGDVASVGLGVVTTGGGAAGGTVLAPVTAGGSVVVGAAVVRTGAVTALAGANNLANQKGRVNAKPTDRRVDLRKGVKEKIKENQPRDKDGNLIDPNTFEVLKEGEIDIGHKKGNEWRVRKKMHEDKGSTRKEVIEAENDPNLYQLENRSSNRSHKHEKKD